MELTFGQLRDNFMANIQPVCIMMEGVEIYDGLAIETPDELDELEITYFETRYDKNDTICVHVR